MTTNNQKTTLSTKEVAKEIRKDLKVFGKDFKFSVTSEYYSGGSSININVMESATRMIRTMSEIPDWNRPQNQSNYTTADIMTMQNGTSHQLNQNQDKEYDAEVWNNGVFLTPEGHEIINKIVAIVEKYHWDESDSMIDYFHTNFYYHLGLGKCDKDFIDGVSN